MWRRGDYEISTDPARLDLELVHRFLSEDAYWSPGVAREVVERSIEGSLPFGIYRSDEQVGFARVVTDYATFAWLADVFVVDGHRGRGLVARRDGPRASRLVRPPALDARHRRRARALHALRLRPGRPAALPRDRVGLDVL
jgi:hypothetical protein